MMKRIFKKLFKKNYLITQLMQTYSLLLAMIITLMMAALCVYVTYNQQETLQAKEQSLLYQMDTYVGNKNDAMTNLVSDLVNSPAKIENLRNYMSLTPAEYFDYRYSIWSDYNTEINFADRLRSLFGTYPDLEELYIKLDESEMYLQADRNQTNGRLVSQPQTNQNEFHLMRVISDEYTGQVLGEVHAFFSEASVLGNQQETISANGLNAFIYDSAGKRIFSSGEQVTTAELQRLDKQMQQNGGFDFPTKRYHVQRLETSGRISLVLLMSKRVFIQQVLRYYCLIFVIGILLIGVLLIILNRTFKRYTKQVDLIVEATRIVGDGNLKERVDVEHVQEELHDIATAINFMLESLDRYIEDIYTLEIKQRDANMRALQSQINPHFLYNTLEYIRMYALSRQQVELADVVYAFAALLRNNIDQSKTTELEKEMSFCEKYVYLYQMRYPDAFAYKLDIEEAIFNIEIPKFIIQPLIENYFVHGIDYNRKDNGLSVKAYQEGSRVVIQVSDNGKGMTPEQLQAIRQKLELTEVEMVQSIGLRNVHERMKSYFADSYQFEIDSKLGKGTKVVLSFDEKERV